MTFNKQTFLSAISSLRIVILLCLLGCESEVTVINKSTTISSTPILETNEHWFSVTWLSDSQIFLGTRDTEERPPKWEGRIYDFQEDTWQAMQFSESDCPDGRLERWKRLPDRRIGFIYYCNEQGAALYEITHYLVAWDYEADVFEIIKAYPRSLQPFFSSALGISARDFPQYFNPDAFAFKPDFTALIQQDDKIINFTPTLYYVSLDDGEISPILPEFGRAASPSWSPDGQLIAFIGSMTAPNLTGNIFSGLPSLRSALSQPWHLYVMDADRQNIRQILTDIKHPGRVAWSPTDNNRLAFSGTYNRQSGLWLYELEQEQLLFLWSDFGSYDWSPDGQKMILDTCKHDSSNEGLQLSQCTLTIIEVP